MTKSIAAKLLILMLVASSGSIASAAFSISVAGVSGPTINPYNSSSTSGSANLSGGSLFSNGLNFAYNITDSPSLGTYTINNLSFFYIGAGAPIKLTVTITDNAMTFPTPGTVTVGYANFEASGSGDPNATFSDVTTFSGTGANTVTFPTTSFPSSSSANIFFSGSSLFSSGGTPGTISSVFTFNLITGESPSIGAGTDPFGNSYGNFGLAVPAVPLPATALLGVFGVPTLALLRRWTKK